MNKKIALLTAFGLLAFACTAEAKIKEADYVPELTGIQYTTSAFTANAVSAFSGRGVFLGLAVSTGAIGDVFVIADSTSTTAATARGEEVLRIYVGTSTYPNQLQVPPTGGSAVLPVPIRIRRGLVVVPPSALYNRVTILAEPYSK